MASHWEMFEFAVAAEFGMAILLVLPWSKDIQTEMIEIVSVFLKASFAIIPFSVFKLLELYCKNEFLLWCVEENCNDKSIRDAEVHTILCFSACLLYWGLYRIYKFLRQIKSMEEVEKRCICKHHKVIQKVDVRLVESDITLLIEKYESCAATRLNCAANDGDLHRLRRLVEAGADPNKIDYNGQSPLHFSASKGYEDITQFLIQNGVEINLRDNFGKSPLFEAIKNGHDSVASLLVQAGASLSIDNPGNCLCEAVARKDLDFLRRLLANGINPNFKNYDLRTPLHLAASEGLYRESVILLDSGANVFAIDRWGRSPLDEARIGKNRDLLKLLENAKSTRMSEFSYSSRGTSRNFVYGSKVDTQKNIQSNTQT